MIYFKMVNLPTGQYQDQGTYIQHEIDSFLRLFSIERIELPKPLAEFL